MWCHDMAVTKIWDIRGRIGDVILYAENREKTRSREYSAQAIQEMRDVVDYAMDSYIPDESDSQAVRDVMEYAVNANKTDRQYYVSGINCNAEDARAQMIYTKRLVHKEGGITAYHAIQSFAPGEATPDLAHKIGVELAEKLWGDRFEVVVATHLNTGCLHNHFVINSVSFADGKRYYDNKKTYRELRQASDELCRQYELSIIRGNKGYSRHYAEWLAEQRGEPTLRSVIRKDVDAALKASMTWEQFLNNLRKQGYSLKTNVKYVAVKPPGKEGHIRLRSLGKNYTEQAIRQRILAQRAPERMPRMAPPVVRRIRYRGVFGFTLHKVTWKGLRALYFHYLHLLQKARAQESRAPFSLREDLRHFNALAAQCKLLNVNKIETKEQLQSYRAAISEEIDALRISRKALSDEKRRVGTDERRMAELTENVKKITKKLKRLHREVRLCDGIGERSTFVHERLVLAREKHREYARQIGKTILHAKARGDYPPRNEHR